MSKFKLIPLDLVTSKQYENKWLIKNVMEEASIGMFFGAPASGKSLIAMDIAFCIASGISWNKNETKQGNVVYIAGEGFNGLGKRFKALQTKYNTTTKNLYLSEIPAHLSDRESADEVYREIRRNCPNPSLIVIDTLHRNFGAGDENSSRDLGEFIYIMSALVKATGTTILIIHHSGHSSSERARGSSSIRAAMDFEYKLKKSGSSITMACTKAKEFEEPPPSSFNIKILPIPGWFDDDGKPVEGAILESTAHKQAVGEPGLKDKDQQSLNALQGVIASKGLPAKADHLNEYPELAGKKYILLSTWRDKAFPIFDSGNIQKDSVRQAFLRSKEKLIKIAKVVVIEDCCYCLD